MNGHRSLFASVVLGLAACVAAEPVTVRFGGRLMLPAFKTMLEPRAAGGDWSFIGGAGGFLPEKDGAYRFTIYPNHRPEIAGTMRVSTPTADVVRVDYVFTPKADLTLRGGFVNLDLQYADLQGARLLVEGRCVNVPKGTTRFALPREACRRLSVVRDDGARMDIEIVSPESTLWLQNNRPWGFESASVRIGFPREADGSFKGGKDYALSLVVKGAGALDTRPPRKVVIQAGPDWVPIRMRGEVKPGSALDFSAIRRTEAPAGKHGRVVAKGAHFEFERLPGVAQRFYGANVCMSANVPPKEASRRFAADFARRGYNSVRLHHHERPLVEGMKDPAALTFNPEALDRFDALIASCVTNGIYLTTDLFVTRAPITYRAIGIDRPGELPVMDFKFYVPIHPGAWSNFCAWTRMFLTHRNPYTGRTLAEEPALACLSLVNEGPLNAKDGGFYASVPEWKAAWLKWIAAKRTKDPQKWAKVRDEIPSNYGENAQGAAFLAFLADVERDFAERVRKLVHGELACPVPLANMNNNSCMGLQGVRDAAYEYVDDHFYVDHPQFLGKPWSLPSECPNVNPVMNMRLGAHTSALERSFDKPFAVSEYNYCGPGRFRGCGGIVTAAEGALQDWSALWRFAWTHSHHMMGNTTRGTVGYFDAAGDPLALASDRASICLFLRGDLAPLENEYPIRFPDGVQDAPNPLMAKTTAMNLTWATWYRRIGLTLKDRPGQISLADAYARTEAQVRADLALPAEEGEWPVAGDGALKVDPRDGSFCLSTPRTSGGFTGGREIRSSALDATLDGQAATVWASSLDDAPIAASGRLLVTHLPDVQNDKVAYADENLRIMLENGRSAPMMRACKASIVLRCAQGPWKVYALGTDGSRRREVAATYSDGALRFVSDTAADRTDATFLYEVVRSAAPGGEVDDFYAMDTAFSWMTGHRLACTNDVKEHFAGILDDMQVPNVRERFSWNRANPARGVWKWGDYVKNAQLLRQRGFRVSDTFHDAPAWTDIPHDGGLPRDLRAVYESCRAIAVAFGDAVETWEVWNEEDIIVFSKAPAWDYAAFLKAAYQGFKAAPHPPRVALGALSLDHRNAFDEALFANDAAAYFDVFNFHTYVAIDNYDQVFGELNRFRQTHGIGDRFYYLTEFGRDFPATGAPRASGEALQAEFIPKAWMRQRMCGVGRGYYFIFGLYRQKNGTCELGLLRENGERKAACLALKRHLAEVGRARLEGELAAGDGVKAYLFTAADGSQSLMYWSVSPVDVGCARKGDYRVGNELSRSFRVGGRALTARRVPDYAHGLHGLVPAVRPAPHGRVGAPPAAEDEDRSVVLRIDFAPGDTLLDGDRGGVEILKKELHAKVVVWNLSDKAKKGHLLSTGGVLRKAPGELSLAPWGCVTADVVRVSSAAEAIANWTLSGVFDGKRTSRLVVPVRDFGAAEFQRTPLALEAADWKLNDSASTRQVVSEADGSFRFDYAWKDLRTDRWFYPRPDLKGLSLAGMRFVEFEVAATGPGAKEGWKHCHLIVRRPGDRSPTYLAFAPPADDGSWEVRRVKLPTDFTPASFTLGGNPVGTNVTWRIRRLALLK